MRLPWQGGEGPGRGNAPAIHHQAGEELSGGGTGAAGGSGPGGQTVAVVLWSSGEQGPDRHNYLKRICITAGLRGSPCGVWASPGHTSPGPRQQCGAARRPGGGNWRPISQAAGTSLVCEWPDPGNILGGALWESLSPGSGFVWKQTW